MKNKQRTTNNEQRTYRAFTLIELVVSIALLAIVFLFAGTIFKVSINAYRTAGANAEIMQKLRAITDQLNTDFKGIRTDSPLLIWFKQDTNDPNQRFDQIMFFAGGDFQSTQLYDGPSGFEVPAPTGDPVVGNVARVFYGQAQIIDANGNGRYPSDLRDKDRLLARRQHILTADEDLEEWPDADMSDFHDVWNEWYEHDSLSLAHWKTIDWGNDGDVIVDTCFEFRPLIDMDDPNTFHKLMCEGVGSFAIQWAYWDYGDERFYWFPSNDPDGDGHNIDSHFDLMGDEFGIYFNIPSSTIITGWDPIEDAEYEPGDYFPSNFYPKALKFTFTLYDSKGIIKKDGRAGRTFTHIVYLGD